MYRKAFISFIAFVFVFVSSDLFVQAKSDLASLQNDDIHVLFIYSNDKNKETENVRKLDLILHHFTQNVSITSDFSLLENNIHPITHIVYYGEDKKDLRTETKQLVNNFAGPIIAIGENIEQFSAFQSFKVAENVQINSISFEKEKEKRDVTGKIMVNRLDDTQEMQTLLYGYEDLIPFPMMTKRNEAYYLAATKLDDLMLAYFSELLHDIFPNNHSNEHKAYIRLGNIHPASDPEIVLAVAEELVARNIPFLLAVTPVYTNPESNEQVHLKDADKLLDVLRYIQEVNGSVIMHGYTNDALLGYEFWDAELDQFVTGVDAEGNRTKIHMQQDFPNEALYDSFIKTKMAEEKSYLVNRFESAIYEEVREGIYPVAFSAPLHAMSEQGYQLVSNYYSAMFGRVQLTDETYRSMYTPPFVTTGSFLNGLTIYPETIGDVTDFTSNSYAHIEEKLDQALILRDSVIGATYQTYLGVDYLDDFIKRIEQIPNVHWLNIQETEQLVTVEKVSIKTSESSELVVNNELTWLDEWKEVRQQLTLFEKLLWGVTFLVFIFIIMFLIFALHLRLQLKKRLFKERR